MTVEELLRAISAAYPGATVEALAAFKPVFLARLRHREGPHLADAVAAVLAEFKPTVRQPFPIPVHFEAHLPTAGKVDNGKEQPLDFKGRADRHRAMMATWRRKQGDKASRGVVEVLRALQHIAEPLILREAWKTDAQQVYLTEKQLKLGRQRAVSLERLRLHGTPPKDTGTWWAQISEIQQRWGLELTLDDWTQDKPEKPLEHRDEPVGEAA